MKQRYYLYIFHLYKAKKENSTLISSFNCTIYYHSYYYVIDVAYFKVDTAQYLQIMLHHEFMIHEVSEV